MPASQRAMRAFGVMGVRRTTRAAQATVRAARAIRAIGVMGAAVLWLCAATAAFAAPPAAAPAAPAAPAVSATPATPQPVVVFAAASLTNALQDIGDAFTRETSIPVKFSFAASSALARQIENGAPADVFFSADLEWVQYLETRHLLKSGSRHDVLGNRLVMIAPADHLIELKIAPHFALAAALGSGRLATGDPDSVPVGRYAREALTRLGVWTEIESRLVRADSVRSALAFVDRGEAALGIVYETDALVDKRVRMVDVFPEDSHSPIVYPIALTATATGEAARFASFVRGPAAALTFKAYGFKPLP